MQSTCGFLGLVLLNFTAVQCFVGECRNLCHQLKAWVCGSVVERMKRLSVPRAASEMQVNSPPERLDTLNSLFKCVCVSQDDVLCGNLSPLCGLHLGCPTFRAHFVLIIDWKCLQNSVNDFVYALKKKTIISNSHCKKNKKPGGEQGKRTILIKETITRVRNSSVKGRLSPLMHKHQHSGVITLDAQTLLGEPSATIDWFIHWKLIVPSTAQGHLRASR